MSILSSLNTRPLQAFGLFAMTVAGLAMISLSQLGRGPAAAPEAALRSFNQSDRAPSLPAEPELFVMKAAISGVALLAALFVILTRRYELKDKNWAYGTAGTVIGFWLNGA